MIIFVYTWKDTREVHIFLTDEELTKSVRTMQTDEEAILIFGPKNRNLKIFENELGVSLKTRGKQLVIEGSESKVIQVGNIISQLEQLSESKESIEPLEILNAIRLSKEGKLNRFLAVYEKR